MLNVHLSYNPPSSWRIFLWSGVLPRQFSCLKKFRSMVVPDRGCRKGVILQGRQLKCRFSWVGQSCLRIKGDVTGQSDHAPRQRNSKYKQMVILSIYKTRQNKHPHFPIHQYKQFPQGPTPRPRYIEKSSQGETYSAGT